MNVLAPDIPDSFPAREVFGRAAVRLFLVVALGIVLAAGLEYRMGPLLWACGLAFAIASCVPACRMSGTVRRVLLLSAIVCASGAWTTLRASHAPADSLARVLDEHPILIQLEGVVTDEPRSTAGGSGALAEAARYAPPSVRFRFETERVLDSSERWTDASSALYASVTATESVEFRAGDRVRLLGMASALRRSGNPGAHDPGPAAMQRGIVGSIHISRPALIAVTRESSGAAGFLARHRSGVIDRIEAAGERSGRDSASALLSALLLGERSGAALRPLEDAFTRTGVGHFLAISGLHVGMVLVGLAFAVRVTGDRPRVEAAVVICAALLLLVFIPARPPVLRAVLIALALILSQSGGRLYDRLSVLALVATALLIARPIDLFNPGYQLTFLVVAALIMCARPLRVWMFGEPAGTDELRGRQHATQRLKDAAAVSICASAVSTPLIALHFGVFTPLAAPLSVLLMPLVALILGTGYLALLVGSVLPSLLDRSIDLALHPAVWLAETVRRIDTLPGVAVYLPSISWALAGGAIVVAVWWMFPSYTTERRRRIATAVVLLPIAAGTLVGPSLPRSQALRLDMLDVGDGTAVLLRSGRDAVLYDCGSRWLGIGEREIPRAVRALGAGRVRTVVVSHPDIDHFSGLIDAARPLGVRRVVVPPQFLAQSEQQPDGAAALLVRRLGELGIVIEAAHRGDTLPLGGASLEFLHPAPEDRFRHDNDGSLVVRILPERADGPVVLLTGDIERGAMGLLESREPGLRADVIEVPHHGSARSFAYPFVEALDPRVLLQSTGPSRLLDERWDTIRAGREWFTTAADGAITVIIDRDGTVRTAVFRRSG